MTRPPASPHPWRQSRWIPPLPRLATPQEFRREYDKQLKEEKRQRAQQAAAARAQPRPGSAARVGGGAPSRSGLKAWSGSAPRPNSALRELKASRPNLGTAADSLDKLRM